MRYLFSPAIAFVSKLRFAQKFILIALILAIPTLYMLGRIILNFNAQLVVLEAESQGLKVAHTLNSIIDLSQKHRGLSTSYLQGKTDFAPAIDEVEQKLKTQLQSIDPLINTSELQSLSPAWQQLKPQLESMANNWKQQKAGDNFSTHTQTITQALKMMGDIAHKSGLALDPETDSYYLQDVFFNQILSVSEALAQARGIGSRLAVAKSATTEEQITMSTLSALIGVSIEPLTIKIARTEQGGLKHDAEAIAKQLKEDQHYLLAEFSGVEVAVDPAAHFKRLSETLEHLSALSTQIFTTMDQLLEQREARLMLERIWVLGLALVMLALGSYLFIGAFLSINSAVLALRAEAERLAKGDLSRKVELDVKDELADVGESFNQMATSLKNVIGQIRQNAAAVANSAQRLSRNSEDVVLASREQANASGQMAAAMEQMSVSIATVSEHAAASEQQARQAQNEVDHGQQIMESVLNEITELSGNLETLGANVDSMKTHSVEIGKIVQVIKDIAEQTNLLALNAAIEAARAGEQGRGFAVVADEVRKLAERTATSTGEINQLVATIRKDTDEAANGMDVARAEMERGSQRVGEATHALSHIRDSSRAELDAAAEINSAMSEQKQASHSVAQSVERIARMAEDNSHRADENASLSNELQRNSIELDRLVAQFKLS